MKTLTLDLAIQKGQELDFQAREGWPAGVPENLHEVAAFVLHTIDLHVQAAPAAERRDVAVHIKARLEGRVFKAGVTPKRRSA